MGTNHQGGGRALQRHLLAKSSMVYPALTYLEELGYTASESEGTKKHYRITEAGTAYLDENRVGVEETLDQLARFGRKLAQFQKQFKEDNEESDDLGPGPRGGIKSEWRTGKDGSPRATK